MVQRVQRDGTVVAKSFDVKQANQVDLDSLPTSSICCELNLPMILKDNAGRLHEVGLLSELKSEDILLYLRGPEAKADLASFTDLIGSLTKAEEHRVKE